MREVRAQGVADGDGAVAAAHADVDVRRPGVVAPRHVLEPVLDQPVVRRVDDLLVLPLRERVRAGAAELVALRVGVLEELRAVEQELLRRLPEVQRARRAHLDLGGEQLAGDALAQARRRRVAQRLEGAGERERLGVEYLELLLEPQVEVVRVVEPRLDLLEVCGKVGSHRGALYRIRTTLTHGRHRPPFAQRRSTAAQHRGRTRPARLASASRAGRCHPRASVARARRTSYCATGGVDGSGVGSTSGVQVEVLDARDRVDLRAVLGLRDLALDLHLVAGGQSSRELSTSPSSVSCQTGRRRPRRTPSRCASCP